MAQLNEEILAEILERYKEKLPEIRPNEIYKWRATKKFQDAWDPHAENVAAMLEEALSGANNLLTGYLYYPCCLGLRRSTLEKLLMLSLIFLMKRGI